MTNDGEQGRGQEQPSAHGGGSGGGGDWQRDVLRELGGGGSGPSDAGTHTGAEAGARAGARAGTEGDAPGPHAPGAVLPDASASPDAPPSAPGAPDGPASPSPIAADRAIDEPVPERPAAPAVPAPASVPAHGSRLPAAPAPESSPTLDPRLLLALGRPLRGDSVTRRTGRALRGLTSSAAQDVAEQTRIAREVQQPVTTGRVVAVTSISGGVGKSTVSALLGRTLNHYRHDPVLTLEADAALGTLPVRLGAEAVRWTCADLASVLHPSMRLTDVTGYLVPVPDGGWLLPAGRGQVGPPLDMTSYRKVTLALRRYFAVTVVDCETLPGEVARTAMDTAHARVVVSPATAEGVNATRQVLDWLARLPHSALATTVVALVSGTPDALLDGKTAAGHLKEAGVTVVTVPYDRHLAGGGPIRTDLLAHDTRQAVLRLAAEVMGRAVRVR
ncbi:MinD/ParA family ATP-binding protein [Streptomyces prasinus]|uniref:MinD/ParA family ATP-binding protein n=1 Tax=Streptomyces prasinus TaxID=67345 RepID=UPI0036A1C399